MAKATTSLGDESHVRQEYFHWRLRIFLSMYLGYVLYYFTRKSFSFAMPALMDEMSLTEADVGGIASILALAYALSKFVSGMLCDRSSPRWFMGLGLIFTGVINVMFGSGGAAGFFLLLWFANGLFQGMGAPPCAKLMVQWYSQKERGKWWSAWNTAHNVGGAIIAILVGFCVTRFGGWQWGMLIPGVLAIVGGLGVIIGLRDAPEKVGLPPIEQFHGVVEPAKGSNPPEQLSLYALVVRYVLSNPYIWLLAVSYFFLYLVRTAVNDWSTLYLIREKEYGHFAASSCVAWFEYGGFLGSLVAGWMSDSLFEGRRGPVNVLFMLGAFFSILGMWFVPAHWIWDSAMIFSCGFCIFGPQLLIGMAAAELAHKQAAASATGFAGLLGYVGAAVAGYPCGVIVMHWGWQGLFLSLSACCIIGLCLLLPTWSVVSRFTPPSLPKSPEPQEPEFAV